MSKKIKIYADIITISAGVVKKMVFVVFLFIFLSANLLLAQLQTSLTPVGQWREHLPYQNAISLVKTESKVFCATTYSLFSVDLADNEIERLNKTNGLHDIGISCIGYDATEKKLIIAYSNSNIDLYDGSRCINIPDLKRKNISGDKSIYHIYSNNGLAYLSTGIGILVLDEKKHEFKDSYFIGAGGNYLRINAFTSDANWLYAATAAGLKRAPANSPNLTDFSVWQTIGDFGNDNITSVNILNGTIIVSKNDSLFSYKNNISTFLYADPFPILSVNISEGKVIACHRNTAGASKVNQLNENGILEKSVSQPGVISFPKQAILVNGNVWTADYFGGLSKNANGSFQQFIPNGPPGTVSGEITVYKNSLWAASGAVNSAWNYQYNRNGLFRLSEDNWKACNQFLGYPVMDSALDIISVAADKKDGSVWCGSYGGGLLHFTTDERLQIIKQNSSLQPAIGDPGSYRVSGLAFDSEQNLWISNYGAGNAISVKKSDGSFKNFRIPFSIVDNAVAQILVDDHDLKWIVSPKSNGLICYHSGNSIDNTGDDKWKYFKAGPGQGNLPDNDVYCVASDKQQNIWVGTANGIGIISCSDDIFTSTGCEAVLPVVQQDLFAGYLFQGQQVQSIAVDAANRKWIGTKNGVWLVSQDGDKTILHFTEDNSPLLSNDIKRIAIDDATGEVFFASFNGICSYRGNAIAANENKQELLVFPNPVPPAYTGTIAIKGLVDQSFVLISELNGRLVCQTRALGGQAIWNGKDLQGKRLSPGVYLVQVTNEDRKIHATGKIFILK